MAAMYELEDPSAIKDQRLVSLKMIIKDFMIYFN
jgi:hypothetical protein